MTMISILRLAPLIIICVVIFVYFCDARQLPYYPELKSMLILNKTTEVKNNRLFNKLVIEFKGENLDLDYELKLGKYYENCSEDNFYQNIYKSWTNSTNTLFFVIYPNDIITNLYVCIKYKLNSVDFGGEVIKWHYTGLNIFKNNTDSRTFNLNLIQNFDFHNRKNVRWKREVDVTTTTIKATTNTQAATNIRITGIRVEEAEKEPKYDDGVPSLLSGTRALVRIFGTGLTESTVITFTHQPRNYGGECQMPATDAFTIRNFEADKETAQLEIRLPSSENKPFYICAKEDKSLGGDPDVKVNEAIPFIHQGTDKWIQINSYERFIPIWASMIIIIILLAFSALFSGLNLGLMALDRTELKILCNTGNEIERKYAKKIQPVRDHGNYLLCSILLGNVLVNSIFTILLDDLTSGLVAVIFSTLAIVMFGEISPQAICSRYGLAVGAKTIYITKAVMVITAPLSYPASKILDAILGEEIGNVYNRERLKELVKITTDVNDLDKDEVNIISGALELRRKTVADVMTKIEDVFMLNLEAILDFETVSEIMKTGFSRIPVYEGNRQNIVTVLYIKDLAFVDPDDNTPLKTLCHFYQNPCNFVFEDLTLDIMFKEFKEGNKGHMAFVHRVNSEGEGDPFYEVIGLVTLEDVIEELIQAEIMDETDVFTDNRSKRRRNQDRGKQDFSMFAERRENQQLHISPQLTLATYQYLSASVDMFKPEVISEQTLKRLLKQDIYCHIKKKENKKDGHIYQQGKPVDFFVLILEGRVEVTVGKENLVFEGGPFTYFGLQALMTNVQTDVNIGKQKSKKKDYGWIRQESRLIARVPKRPSSADPNTHPNLQAIADENNTVESPVAPNNMGSLQSLNMDAMIKYTFQPDYSVRAVTDVLYMRVRRSLYLAAKRATLMERSQRDVNGTEQFDAEMEKDQDLMRMFSHITHIEDKSSPYSHSNRTSQTGFAQSSRSNQPSFSQPGPSNQNQPGPSNQNQAEHFNQYQADPFNQNQADPFNQNQADPFNQNQTGPSSSKRTKSYDNTTPDNRSERLISNINSYVSTKASLSDSERARQNERRISFYQPEHEDIPEQLLCSLDDEDGSMGRMSPNKQSDKDIRAQDTALIHSLSHGSQSSPRLQSNNTSPASFSPRDLSTANVNGIVKFSTGGGDEPHDPEEDSTLLEEHKDVS